MLPRYLYRVFTSRSASSYSPQEGFLSASQDPADDSHSAFERHIDRQNTIPTPFISATFDPFWALKIAANSNGPDVRIAVIDAHAADLAQATIYRAIDLASEVLENPAQINKYSSEYIFKHWIPANSIIACVPLEMLALRGLYRCCPFLGEYKHLDDLRRRTREYLGFDSNGRQCGFFAAAIAHLWISCIEHPAAEALRRELSLELAYSLTVDSDQDNFTGGVESGMNDWLQYWNSYVPLGCEEFDTSEQVDVELNRLIDAANDPAQKNRAAVVARVENISQEASYGKETTLGEEKEWKAFLIYKGVEVIHSLFQDQALLFHQHFP